MEEVVGFGLTRSHLTAIPRFVFGDFIALKQNVPASARSRNPRRRVFSSSPHKIKMGLRKLSPFLLGGGGIRTHGTLARTTVFKTAPINRSGTPPKVFNWLLIYHTQNIFCCKEGRFICYIILLRGD